jgi:hypothetical protein
MASLAHVVAWWQSVVSSVSRAPQMLRVSQTMAALEAARAARAAIPNPPNTPGVESLVASFISKVDACQSSVDRLTSMVEAELAAALADTTSALAVCRLQVGTPAQPLCDTGVC